MKPSTTRTLLAATIALPALGYCWLSFGVFSDREFGTLYLFKKHRLSSRLFFYSPVGESDTPASSLPSGAQRAEADFEEFVERGGDYYRKFRLFR